MALLLIPNMNRCSLGMSNLGKASLLVNRVGWAVGMVIWRLGISIRQIRQDFDYNLASSGVMGLQCAHL